MPKPRQNEGGRITTIKLREETKARLEHLKEQNDETYDSLIKKALNILNVCRKAPSFAARILRDIDKSKKRKILIENPEKLSRKKAAHSALEPITQKIFNAQRNLQRIRE